MKQSFTLDFKLSPCFESCLYFLGIISPASDYGLPTFRNTLSVPSSKAGCEVLHIQPLKMEQIECSETSANHNQTPGKYPKEYRQDDFHFSLTKDIEKPVTKYINT